MSASRGKLVVISGPSGAGKTSVCRALKLRPDVEFSVSATTRQRRDGEQDGVDYHFLALEDFQRRVAENQFLEWAGYNGNLYGTPRWPMDTALAQGKTFLVEIEVKGTRQLREGGVPGLYVFIAPPSLPELRKRLTARATNDAQEIEQRLRIAAEEIAAARESIGGVPLYDVTVTNDVLQDTIARVEALIWP